MQQASVSQEYALSQSPADQALISLLRLLRERGYRFTTPTPATHQIVVSRPGRSEARCLTDVLGRSLPFREESVERDVLQLLQRAGALQQAGEGRWKSRFRVSSVQEHLFLHSAFPTLDEEAVFFGPDSYRFAALIARELTVRPAASVRRVVDIGAGAGVGAIVASRFYPDADIVMTDVNPEALRLAAINAAAAGVTASFVEGPDLAGLDGSFDLMLANPPYMMDGSHRSYRDGGALHGGAVALEMARKAVGRLAPDGRFILYTGSAIVNGEDELGEALAGLADDAHCSLDYEELDPDVFGEELAQRAYSDVDRIAVVAAIFRR